MTRTALAAGMLLCASAASAQVFQSGGVVPQHFSMWSDNNTVMDAGWSGQTPQGLQPFELGITAAPNATGSPFPATATGHGPNGENFCLYDSPITVSGHYLCLSPNLGGNATISAGTLGAPLGGFNLVLNGVSFPVPGAGNGNVSGPTSPAPTVGDVAIWNGGTTLTSDVPGRFLNKSTAPITAVGPLALAINNNASKSAAQIYQMALGGTGLPQTYDLMQAVAVVPSGSNLLATNGFGAYVLNQNPSLGVGTSQNAVGFFGTAVGAATNAATWGANFLVTDNTSQSGTSPFANQKLTGLEIDVNVWSATTDTYGLLVVGNGGVQPNQSNAILIGSLNFSGLGGGKWVGGFIAGGGCCQIGAIMGTAGPSGNNMNSMPLDFFVTNGSGTVQAYTMNATPTFFDFAHNFAGQSIWAFDGNIAIPANSAVTINSDNALSADGAHNLLVGFSTATVAIGSNGGQVAINNGTGGSVSIGNTTGSIKLLGLPASAGGGGLTVCVDSTGILYKKATCP